MRYFLRATSYAMLTAAYFGLAVLGACNRIQRPNRYVEGEMEVSL